MTIIDSIIKLKNLNKNVTHLIFGDCFDQQTIIPQYITKKAQLFFVG